MAVKAMNIKMEDSRILDIKNVAAVFHMTMTEVISEAITEYLSKVKRDPFYRLTANVEDASAEETNEILEAIDSMSDDDLLIAKAKTFRV